MIFSKTLLLSDYKDDTFYGHKYFTYLTNSWSGLIPYRFEHKHRIWEYGLALQLIQKFNIDSILDVGGGGSLLSPGLASQGYSVTQVNTSDDSSFVTKQSEILEKPITYFQKDFLDFTSRTKYDAVVCTSVIEHVSEDIKFFTRLLTKVKKNGILFLTTDFSPSGQRHSESHLRTYNEKSLNQLISIGNKKGFTLYKNESDYSKFEQNVYNYTFCSLALQNV